MCSGILQERDKALNQFHDSSDDRVVCLALATDDHYTLPTAVTIKSVLTHLHPSYRLEAAILADRVSATNRRLLEDTLSDERVSLQWIDLPTDLGLASYPMSSPLNKEHSPTVWADLYLGDLLPASWRRVIYMDSDMLALGDLSQLFQSDLGGNMVGAVQDDPVPIVSAEFGIRPWRQLGFAAEDPYFNSGILMVDLLKWRAKEVVAAAGSYLARFGDVLTQYDQEVLNVVCHGDWSPLEKKWNVTGWWNYPERRVGPYSDIHDEVMVFHFAGKTKPWKASSPTSPFVEGYRATAQMTAWKRWQISEPTRPSV